MERLLGLSHASGGANVPPRDHVMTLTISHNLYLKDRFKDLKAVKITKHLIAD